MRKLILAAALGVLAATAAGAEEKGPLVEIYMPKLCLACIDWGEHLINNGFQVKYLETADMEAVKRRFKVPREVESNLTARVGGYFVEGHVPAQDIRDLLAEKPKARGLAVPGLPLGAPGLEGESSNSLNCQTGCTVLDPNAKHEPRRQMYETLLVTPQGKTRTYARH